VSIVQPNAKRGSSIAPQLPVKFAEVLWRHASLVLRCVAVEQQRTRTELLEYAATLLKQAHDAYTADVEAGRSDTECRARLGESLELARRVFTTRAAHHGPTAISILDDQLAVWINGHRATSFSRALAALTDPSDPAAKIDTYTWPAEAV
jgi:hypothetical protein